MARPEYDGLSEQSRASIHRLDDARVLLAKQRWRGAMYLAGYALECSLKAKLMKRYRCFNLAELEEKLVERGVIASDSTIYTHQFERLLRAAGELDRLRQNQRVYSSFLIANLWIPAWRYHPGLSDAEEAGDFLEALEETLGWVEKHL